MIIRYLRLFVFLFIFYPLQSSAQKISTQLDQYMELIRPEFSGQKALETTAYVASILVSIMCSGCWNLRGIN